MQLYGCAMKGPTGDYLCNNANAYFATWLRHMPLMLALLQIDGSVSPLQSLVLNGLNISITRDRLFANASGSLSGTTAQVVMSSTAQGTNSSQHIGIVQVNITSDSADSGSSSGSTLQGLLASLSDSIRDKIGISLPEMAPSTASEQPVSSRTSTTADLVYDSVHGLRFVNISLGSARMGLAELSRKLGFDWQAGANGGTDPLTFWAPCVYYAPAKPGAPPLLWSGKQYGAAAEFGVSASVDVPAFGISGVRGVLTIKGRSLTLQVGAEGEGGVGNVVAVSHMRRGTPGCLTWVSLRHQLLLCNHKLRNNLCH
jgi:hypothetical protein